ncbi:MAG: HAD hydrolase family protein [Candidatus Bathyarchaeota archaeon]|nr:HAD hydrolase family protein [Candidatus Bathyarchaeota archaeon]MCX8177408.1 HAD hydrolase family protein [Candidatus Bathyarchaeota archaeon]MDW8193855.1 HAD hydrolase family protein [Nitrososphaerota archaeon]
MSRVFISDCEGPISKNDNAFELASHYIPRGDRFFTVISRYDDVLADVLKRRGYKAGDTLKLILPFLKAYGVTNNEMQSFSARTLMLMPHSGEALQQVRRITRAFIVSTSYEHYVRALCKAIDFPFHSTYCTRVDMDSYRLSLEEKQRLMKLADEIAVMPIIEIPAGACGLDDFPEKHRAAIRRLDEIFWNEIAQMEAGKILREVNPVGGSEKAEAVKDIARKLNVELADIIYVGDSITDAEAFRLVRAGGGLTLSFNGNRYAIRNAEVAVISETGLVTAVIAELFMHLGKEETMNVLENWSWEALEKSPLSRITLEKLAAACKKGLPKVKLVADENMDALIQESEEFRKRVRGEAVGGLG